MRSVATVGRWSIRHPWRAVAAWLAFVALAVAFGIATGTETLDNGAVGESARGYDMLDRYRLWEPPREIAFLHSATLTTRDPRFREAIADVRRRLSPLAVELAPTRRSADGHSALVVATLLNVSADEVRRTVLAAAPAHQEVMIEETGDITASDARDKSVDDDLRRAELLSIPVTLAVLLFAFGAAVAALVPVLLALTAVIATFGLLGPISQAFPIQDAVTTVILLIGMAVGVDYALFYVVRSREERLRGLPSHEAVERAARTSGRTVVVSGTTVIVAMAGMFFVHAKIFDSLAASTITVVACAVAGSVTVLPAVLELLGPRVDRGRIPWLPHLRTESSGSRFWPAVVNRVLRRPALSCALSAGFLLALAIPGAWLHVAKPSDEALAPRDVPALKALADVRRAFPEAGDPARVVAVVSPGQEKELHSQAATLARLAVARGIARPPVRTTGNGAAGSLVLPLVGAGDNEASRHAVAILRDELVPQTLGRIPGVETAVTGDTAEDVDFTRQMKRGIPVVIGFVLALAFVLLFFAFRSIVVPLKAIALNLLSVGAAYGVLQLVFQHGWAEPVLGFTSNGAVVSWLPLFLFVVLFGLSMDYHVFVLSRVREAVDGGMATNDAVRHGITATAGVVTSAALVMVAVFALFGSLSSLELKQAGVGLAAAVLIDATIVRAVLLPSSMALLGDWNWYLPGFLRRGAISLD